MTAKETLPRLTAEDWINEALRTLASSGADSVRVELIAKALKVTKGSFYWHFADRKALLDAMLSVWEGRATNAVGAEVNRRGGDARQRLENLFRIVFASSGRLERAIRAWAAHDEAARIVLERVDSHRLGFLADLFGELGFPARDGAARARFSYRALIGQFALGTPLTSEERIAEAVDIILPMLTRR